MGQSPSSSACSEDGSGLPFVQGNAEFGTRYPTPRLRCSVPTRICEKGDYLLSVRAPVGELNQSNMKMVIGRGLSAIRFSDYDQQFAWHSLKSAVHKLNRVAQGSTFVAVNRHDVECLEISWFSEECNRQHVAYVLDTIDKAIAANEEAITKLKQVRAGMLHDLLSYGLDENGQLRDPIAHPEEFRDSPHGYIPRRWEFKQLKDIVPANRRITYGIVQPGEFDPNGVLLIRGQDYIKGWALRDSFFKVAPSRHDAYRRSLTKAGDLLICIVGATTGAVAQVPAWIEEANITQTTARVACDPEKLVARFALHVLRSELGQKQVRRYVKGSAQPGLNLQDVEMFWIPLPERDEQRAIARILDHHIENELSATNELEKLHQLKSGLLDDLLTGRVRVPETIMEGAAAE